jgi:hypothetical protein
MSKITTPVVTSGVVEPLFLEEGAHFGASVAQDMAREGVAITRASVLARFGEEDSEGDDLLAYLGGLDRMVAVAANWSIRNAGAHNG